MSIPRSVCSREPVPRVRGWLAALALVAIAGGCTDPMPVDDAGAMADAGEDVIDGGVSMPTDAGVVHEDAGPVAEGPCGSPLGAPCSDEAPCPIGWVCGGVASDAVCVPEERPTCDAALMDCPSDYPNCLFFMGGASDQGVCVLDEEASCLCAASEPALTCP